MSESIEVTIAEDGTITAVTHGMYGEKCLDVFALLEHLTNGRIAESRYTDDFTRTDASIRHTSEVEHGIE